MGHSRFAPRPHTEDSLRNPVNRYLQHGNNRPSAAQLESSISYLKDRDDLSVALVVADMCIDLAMSDAANAARNLSHAKDGLNGIVEQVNYLQTKGYSQGDKLHYRSLQAQLRLGEMSNWERAAAGESVEASYEAVLATAAATDPLSHDRASISKMVEFMPVLLGARAENKSRGHGWVGRMALQREERKEMLLADKNPNWDTGIVLSGSASEFESPPTRLQVRMGRNKQSARSINADVLPLSAKLFQIGNPARIIFSCLQEVGETAHMPDLPFSMLSPKALDARTERLLAYYYSREAPLNP